MRRSLAIFLTLVACQSSIAAGVVMINLYAGQADLDPGCVLYGNIENFVIDRGGIVPTAIILGGIVLGLVVFYRHLLFIHVSSGRQRKNSFGSIGSLSFGSVRRIL